MLNICDIGFETYYMLSDLTAQQVNDLYETQNSYDVKLWVMDDYEGHQDFLVDGFYNILTWEGCSVTEVSYYPICAEITYETIDNDGKYYVTVHCEDSYYRYANIWVVIKDGDEEIDSVNIGDGEYSPTAFPIPTFTTYERNDYTVEIYAEDLWGSESGLLTNVFNEVINFAV